jgi:hypothetical protein
LIIDVSFQLPDRPAGQRMCFLLSSARSGPTTTDHALKEKHPTDQRSSERSTRVASIRRVQILRKFGAPPKIRRVLLGVTYRRQRHASVTPLIYWTFPLKRSVLPALARFLRGDARGSLFVSLQTMTKDVNL